MKEVRLADAFVPLGCPPDQAYSAVHVGAGALWADAYAEVRTRNGICVQGGGCTTVGVAGLMQGGVSAASPNGTTGDSSYATTAQRRGLIQRAALCSPRGRF